MADCFAGAELHPGTNPPRGAAGGAGPRQDHGGDLPPRGQGQGRPHLARGVLGPQARRAISICH